MTTDLTSRLPSGTVTFLRSDVEGSMAFARDHGPVWDEANARHVALLTDVIDRNGGAVVRTEGDAVFAAFASASSALRAAVEGQRAMRGEPWPAGLSVAVRMALHSGDTHLSGPDYGGFEVNRAARIAAVGHGNQILLSKATYQLVRDQLPGGVTTRHLGDYVLKDLPRPETLLQLVIDGLPADFPPLRAGRATAGNLEERLTSFVGRDDALDELRGLLDGSRLLTLVGPGGIGKTSLAVELARSVAGQYPDGAWFVPLAAIEDARDAPALIARTLGLHDGSVAAADTLPDFTADRSMLLVLDNFEHVLDGAGEVPRLLRASPRSRMVVTSRAALRVAGEQEYPVRALDDPAMARRLFTERARAASPGWTPPPDDAVIQEICALLDGLPLGIELAAARVPVLPLDAIRDRLAARLALPGPSRRDVPSRQRTLTEAVAWSHDLLPSPLQRILHRMAVFEGGIGVEQAATVIGTDAEDALHQLGGLAEHSLLERDVTGAEPRFRMLRTIRAFAAARLAADGDEAAVSARHAQAMRELGRQFAAVEGTADQPCWVSRLTPDEANIRAAVGWSIDNGDYAVAWEMVANFWRFWQVGGYLAQGRALAEAALAIPDAPTEHPGLMWALGAAGSLAYWQEDSEAAAQWYSEQVDLARKLGDERGLADALFNRGHVALLGSVDIEAVGRAVDEVRELYRRAGDERGLARVGWARSMYLVETGHTGPAVEEIRRLHDRFAELGDTQYHAMTTMGLAFAEYRLGDRDAAIRMMADSMRESYEHGDLATATISLPIGSLILMLTGHIDLVPRMAGAFDALSRRFGVRSPASLSRFLDYQDPVAAARRAVPAETFELEYAAGSRMTLGEAVDMATRLAGTARSGRPAGTAQSGRGDEAHLGG